MIATRCTRSGVLGAVLAATLALACGDSDPTSVDDSPLDGLARVTASDSGGTTPPGAPTSPTSGYFRGTVLGHQPEPVAPGSDTLALFPRLANVRVTAYPRVQSSTDSLGVGPAAASVLTNANGEFQLPALPGGEYVVTFNPPPGSPYSGVYATATAYSESGNYPWWVVLPTK